MRVAASHIRVGTFEFFASRGETEQVRKLAEYTIARHDPEIADAQQPFLALLEAVAARQSALIAQWMNTDNMAISGETIDYRPCAFMEAYDPATVFSSIDQHGRYAFGNQPAIAQWNLARLAEALLHGGRVDFTIGWRRLANAAAGDEAPLRALFADGRALDEWLARWRERCASEVSGEGKELAMAGIERANAMRSINPCVIPRNHRVE